MESLVKFKIPANLTFSNFDAVFQINPWFTEAHVETGGKDSISYKSIGKKNCSLLVSVVRNVLCWRNIFEF